MPTELKRCFAGCCHFVDNRAVSQADYDKAFQNQIEILIACRNIPAGHHQKNVEAATGFYLGSRFRRAYGTLLPAGGAIVFNSITGEMLRDASSEDIKNWNNEWERLIPGAKS
jgi:hypothetical protein